MSSYSASRLRCQVEVGGVKLQVLADSDAYSNIFDEHTWETLKAKKTKCTSRIVPQNNIHGKHSKTRRSNVRLGLYHKTSAYIRMVRST